MAFNLKISARERRLAAATALVLLSGVIYLSVVEPVSVSWIETRARARDAEARLATLRQLIDNRDLIETEFKRLERAVTTGESEQELKISLLAEIDRLASQSGLQVASIKPSAVRKQKDFHRYGVELQAHGENHKVVEFMTAMQSPQHILNIDQMSVHAGRGTAPLTVTFRISKLARLTGPKTTNEAAR